MLAVAWQGHVFLGKGQPVVPDRIVPDLLLLSLRPPAADRDDVPPALERIHQAGKKNRGSALQANGKMCIRDSLYAG